MKCSLLRACKWQVLCNIYLIRNSHYMMLFCSNCPISRGQIPSTYTKIASCKALINKLMTLQISLRCLSYVIYEFRDYGKNVMPLHCAFKVVTMKIQWTGHTLLGIYFHCKVLLISIPCAQFCYLQYSVRS